jgi:hypothetical protein
VSDTCACTFCTCPLEAEVVRAGSGADPFPCLTEVPLTRFSHCSCFHHTKTKFIHSSSTPTILSSIHFIHSSRSTLRITYHTSSHHPPTQTRRRALERLLSFHFGRRILRVDPRALQTKLPTSSSSLRIRIPIRIPINGNG